MTDYYGCFSDFYVVFGESLPCRQNLALLQMN